MANPSNISRRQFLRVAGTALAGLAITACAGPEASPKPTDPPSTSATSAPQTGATPKPVSQPTTITFWTMNYADPEQWLQMIRDMGEQFKEATNISVDVQMINWANAWQTYLLVSQGGAHPDCADMYWLYSFTALGGGKHGPMPITELKDELWPDLEERFYPGNLKDVFWNGEFYGIPWRTGVRPLMYRTDMLQEAGIAKPPDTWEEMADVAVKLTQKDNSGNVTRRGFSFGEGGASGVTQLIPYCWQAGAEFMTEDGKTATIDTPEMRKALAWMSDMVWKHQVVHPNFMEKSFNSRELFISGQVAIIGAIDETFGKNLERDNPELDGKWMYSINAKGPVNRASFAGAGYWGVLRGTTKMREAAQWIQFLSRDENMQQFSERNGSLSPNRNVMASTFWSDKPWKVEIGKALEHARTSQHPTPAWSQLTVAEPGGVLYDMFYAVLVNKKSPDEVLPQAQKLMQEKMDAALS